MNYRTRIASSLTAVSLLGLCIFAGAKDILAQQPAPDGKPGDAKGPVKSVLLSGQSNMTGRGYPGVLSKPAADQKARLVHFIMKPQNVEKYKFLYSGPNKDKTGWTIRDDVFITYGEWPHPKRGEEGYSDYKRHGGWGCTMAAEAAGASALSWGSATCWATTAKKQCCW